MSCRVLLIDDDFDLGHLIQVGLAGCRVHRVQTLDQAREVLSSDDRYEAIILDATLGGEDGLVLAEERRDMPPPIIVLTGDASTATRARAHAAGAFAFLTKPFDFGELERLVQEASHRDHEQEELE